MVVCDFHYCTKIKYSPTPYLCFTKPCAYPDSTLTATASVSVVGSNEEARTFRWTAAISDTAFMSYINDCPKLFLILLHQASDSIPFNL